jgi:hypothetical protein
MELGPTADRDARASLIVVKAPGVPPGQPTVVSVANARLAGTRRTNRQINSSLNPEELIYIVSFPSRFWILKFEKIRRNFKSTNLFLPSM